MDYLVSVIVPVFNTESQLVRCLNSILCQTFANIECILVDDYSTDNSIQICERYLNANSNFKLLKNNCNIGSSLTRARGLALAKGKYILFVDSDDWLEPSMIQTMYNAAISNNADIVLCDYYKDNDTSQIVSQSIDGLNKTDIIKYMASYNECLICSLWNKLIARDIIAKIIFPVESYGEDMYLSTQLVYYSNKIIHVNEALYHYCINEKSLCFNPKYAEKRILDQHAICEQIVAFLSEKFGHGLDMFNPDLNIRLHKMQTRYDALKRGIPLSEIATLII